MMKRCLLTILGLMISPVIINAQIIHGNPQKSSYISPSDYPTPPPSCQIHWLSPGVNVTMNIPGHTHNDPGFPYYMEWGLTPFRVHLTFTLFMTAGVLDVNYIYGNIISDFTPDDPSVWPFRGDPDGLVSTGGTVTFNPSLLGASYPLHGWLKWMVNVRTFFSNGDIPITNQIMLPIYSVVDPTAPEVAPGDGIGYPFTGCLGSGGDLAFGNSTVEVHQILPINGPISPEHPWTIRFFTYEYGSISASLPDGIFNIWLDPDLHHGITGTLLATTTGHTTTTMDYRFPDNIPGGTHKIMAQWVQANVAGQVLTSNLVFTITVGPGGVEQPLDNVIGTALPPPIINPPPAPTQTWQNVVPEFQQLLDSVTGFLAQFKICANGICQVIH